MDHDTYTEILKKIEEYCERTKKNFSIQANQYFDNISKHKTQKSSNKKIPSKRKSKPENEKKSKAQKKIKKNETESDENEMEYNSNSFQNKLKFDSSNISSDHPPAPDIKIFEEEISDIYSSDSCSLLDTESEKNEQNSSDRNGSDIEHLITELKTNTSNKKEIINKIESFVSSLSKLDSKERQKHINILNSIEKINLTTEDVQIKISNSFIIDEDWDLLYEKLINAEKENNEIKILEIMRRIGNAFPEELSQELSNKMKPLIKKVKLLSESLHPCESKTRAIKIIDIWNTRLKNNEHDVQSQRKQMDEKFKEIKASKDKVDYEKSSTKSINFIDAGKSIPSKSRRK